MIERDPTGLGAMTPGLTTTDPQIAYWLAQVNLRLRRELAWCWYQRTGEQDPETGQLPSYTGLADDALVWARTDGLRHQFFQQDAACVYLSEFIHTAPPARKRSQRGDWSWLVDTLALTPADEFVMALALAYRVDASIGPVCSAVMNDSHQVWPSLALAQRLWDEPDEITALSLQSHPLRHLGILGNDNDWHQLLAMPAWLAIGLKDGYPAQKTPQQPSSARAKIPLPVAWQSVIDDLPQQEASFIRVPLVGSKHDDFIAYSQAISAYTQIPHKHLTRAELQRQPLSELFLECWLNGVEPVLPWEAKVADEAWPLSLPVRVWQPLSEAAYRASQDALAEPLLCPDGDYTQRLEALKAELGHPIDSRASALEECARRFRLPTALLHRLAAGVGRNKGWQSKDLISACRAASRGSLNRLAQSVDPRFTLEDLVLAPEQQQQFVELADAMTSLTQVHYQWGTANVWNESGLSVLFCGPPGTGKTMAAEALANQLELDMFRVDLSQVVSKYVGETEKNLRQIFDAAEASDCLLFFDESDALFGKRTDVKDAHDRYANIEVSYLLERMERFKGLAVLASNRRKDMDEAFLRRLRYIIEFSMPGIEEREKIWRQGFPVNADTSELDFRFLARQFAFSGGHIRSVIFNTCLQAAAKPEGSPGNGKAGQPSMRQVLLQVRRELQKLNRAADEELFGNYAKLLEGQAA